MWKALAALALLLLAPLGASAQTAGPNVSLPAGSTTNNVQLTGNTQVYPYVLISYAEASLSTGVEAFVALGSSNSVAATTSSQAVPAGGVCQAIGANTWVAGITASSTTTLRLTQYTSCPSIARLNIGGGSGPSPPVFPLHLGSGLNMTGQTNLILPQSRTTLICCSFTVSALFKVSAAIDFRLYSTYDNCISGSWGQATGSPAIINFYVLPGGCGTSSCGVNRACFNPSAIADGNEHMMTLVYDGGIDNQNGTNSIYIDGALVNSVFNIGNTQFPTYAPVPRSAFIFSSVTGRVREFRQYAGRALSAADVAALYADYQADTLPPYGDPLNTNLTVYWPLDASTIVGNEMIDVSGYINNGFFDSTAPTATVTVPSAGATLIGPATLTATATSGPAGVGSIQFQFDGNNAGPVLTTAPYTTTIDTTPFVDGTHIVTAVVRANNGQSASSAPVSVTTSNGTTAHLYYMSAAGGGTACTIGAPCATARFSALHFGEGDSLNLNGGDTFTACWQFSTANVVSAPNYQVTLQSYGTGLATFQGNCPGDSSAAINVNGVNMVVQNLNVRQTGTPGTTGSVQSGVWLQNANGISPIAATVTGINCGGFAYTPDFGACIRVTGFPGPTAGALSSTVITNNTICGLSGPTSPDEAAIGGFGNGQNIFGVNYSNNVICNIGGSGNFEVLNGISLNGVNGAGGVTPGGVAQFNLIHDIGANAAGCGGPTGIITSSALNLLIRFNEVYQVRPTAGTMPLDSCDWDGIDADLLTLNALVTDNYTHLNNGAGYLMFNYNGGSPASNNNTASNNISEEDATTATFGNAGFGCVSFTYESASTIWVFNNTCFNDQTATATTIFSPTVNTAGTGGSPGTHPATLSGTCSVPPSGTITINSSGQLTGYASLVYGYCTVPAFHAAVTCTDSCGLTGATVTPNWNTGCAPGINVFANVSSITYGLAANNLLNVSPCAENIFSGQKAFTPINTTTTGFTTATLQFLNNDLNHTVGPGTPFAIVVEGTTYTSIATFQAAGWGVGNIQVVPQIVGTPPFGNCTTWVPATQTTWPPATNCPPSYQLSAGSNMEGVGTDLTSFIAAHSVTGGVPTKDYYQNAGVYPNTGGGTRWNIGAYGLAP